MFSIEDTLIGIDTGGISDGWNIRFTFTICLHWISEHHHRSSRDTTSTDSVCEIRATRFPPLYHSRSHSVVSCQDQVSLSSLLSHQIKQWRRDLTRRWFRRLCVHCSEQLVLYTNVQVSYAFRSFNLCVWIRIWCMSRKRSDVREKTPAYGSVETREVSTLR